MICLIKWDTFCNAHITSIRTYCPWLLYSPYGVYYCSETTICGNPQFFLFYSHTSTLRIPLYMQFNTRFSEHIDCATETCFLVFSILLHVIFIWGQISSCALVQWQQIYWCCSWILLQYTSLPFLNITTIKIQVII